MNNKVDYFETYDLQAEALYDDEKYTEANTLLESAFEKFPDQYFFIASRILINYRSLDQFDKCLEVVERGVQRGFFFNLQWKSWDPIREIKSSGPILAENERLKKLAQKNAKPEFEVVLPEGYSPERNWPLFICMHCDSGFFGNNELHSRRWRPDAMLKRGFIVVYAQSSQVLSSAGYFWEGDTSQRQDDLRRCYDAITSNYSVDIKKVVTSGFSGGAYAAIDTALNNIFPVKGFIALCTDKPADFSKEKCENMRQRGIKGVIMEGELSGSNPGLQEMVSTFNAVGFHNFFIINKGIGHWYPDDLPAKVDQAINFIMNE